MPIIKNLGHFSNIKVGNPSPLYSYTLTNRVGLFDYGYIFKAYQTAIGKDGAIYICGELNDGTTDDAYLIKCDANLNVIKQVRIHLDGSGDKTVIGLTVDQNGNLFVIGYFKPINETIHDSFLIKFDANLNNIGEKTFESGTDGYLQFTAIAVDVDGNIYISGTVYSGSNNGLIFKLDNDLNVLRQYSYSPTSAIHDNFQDIVIDADGNVYVCGKTETFSKGLIMKLDSDLSIVKQVIISNTDNTWLYGLRLDSQNNVIVCGRHQSDGDINGIIVKLDSNLNIIGAIGFDGAASTEHDFAMSCCINSNDEIYVVGYIRKGSDHDGLLMKLDSSLNVITQKAFAMGLIDRLYDVQIDDDDNLIVCGYMEDSYEKGFVLVNTDGLATLPSSIAGISISDAGTTVSYIVSSVTTTNLVRSPASSIVSVPTVTITDLTSTAHTVHPY